VNDKDVSVLGTGASIPTFDVNVTWLKYVSTAGIFVRRIKFARQLLPVMKNSNLEREFLPK